jgi:hypothetical protein
MKCQIECTRDFHCGWFEIEGDETDEEIGHAVWGYASSSVYKSICKDDSDLDGSTMRWHKYIASIDAEPGNFVGWHVKTLAGSMNEDITQGRDDTGCDGGQTGD